MTILQRIYFFGSVLLMLGILAVFAVLSHKCDLRGGVMLYGSCIKKDAIL